MLGMENLRSDIQKLRNPSVYILYIEEVNIGSNLDKLTNTTCYVYSEKVRPIVLLIM